MTNTMGQIIKKLRKDRGFTQEELAERLGVTYQAVSKWENDIGMPDISLIVPLASVFDISTDVLFGMDRTTEYEDVNRIVSDADNVKVYGNRDTYLEAYDILLDGIKKYPNNLTLISSCMNLGLALSMPDNGWIYAEDKADKIVTETVCQANFIIANSKNISDILRARQCLVFLYCLNNKFELATAEAHHFPVRTDLSLYSNMARVNEYMENYEREAICLCSDIDYSLQAFEDNVARLGMAYYNAGKYRDAITVYERFFDILKVIFRDEYPLPYHDFDSGDCYLLLAQAYLAVGEEDKAMDFVERSVIYYLDLLDNESDGIPYYQFSVKSPIVGKREFKQRIYRNTVKVRLLEKLSSAGIKQLRGNARFICLIDRVNRITE